MKFSLSAFYLSLLLLFLSGTALASAVMSAPAQASADETAKAPPAAQTAQAAPAAQITQITWGQARAETHGAITFRIKPYAETWRGLPGYVANVDFLDTESASFPQAKEIAAYINGQVTETLFYTRLEAEAQQGSDACSYMVHDSAVPCQYETSMKAAEFQNIGSLASVRYISGDFPIGAAHPNHNEVSYNFSLKPMFRIVSLSEIFADPDKAFPKLQAQIRASLMSSQGADGAPLLDKATVWQGTSGWGAFSAFTLTKDGIAVYFSPYAVAAYSFGTQRAFVPYAMVKDDLKPFYRNALGPGK